MIQPVRVKSSKVSVDSSLTGSDSQGNRLAFDRVVTAALLAAVAALIAAASSFTVVVPLITAVGAVVETCSVSSIVF